MAPLKKLLTEVVAANKVKPVADVASGRRVTRSLTRSGDSAVAAAAPPRKRAKKGKAKAADKPAPVAEKEDEEKDECDASDSKSRTIIIEHCKQCNQFKTRAVKVMEGLEKAFSGITVLLNPEKPRRGCFEIREEGGETFISLQDMKRPFKPMKDLDMEQVISNIVAKIQA